MRSHTLEKQGSRPFLLVLLFIASFSVSVTGIRWLAPEPHISFFSERLTTFASHKDDYNLVFVGSSHYRSAIDPLLFDQLMTRAGHPTKSFNFSQPGMYLPEIGYTISRIRALNPASLKWVVIEPWMQEHLNEKNLRKKRLIHYHNLPATLMALRIIQHQPEPARGRLVQYQEHIRHWAYRQTNQGLAVSLVGDFYQRNSRARTSLLLSIISHQGYSPRHGSSIVQAEEKRYQERVRNFPSMYRHSPLKPELARLLVTMLREVETMGALPVFLFAPSVLSPEELILPDDAPAAEIIRLDDVERHPELFALENRWDTGHTNHKGAQLTTAAAAEAFLRIAGGKDER